MNAQQRPNANIRASDALKAAAVIFGLLLGILIILWFLTRMVHTKEAQPNATPLPAKLPLENPPPAR